MFNDLILRCRFHPSYTGNEPMILKCDSCSRVKRIVEILRDNKDAELHYHYHDTTGKIPGRGFIIGNESQCDQERVPLTNG